MFHRSPHIFYVLVVIYIEIVSTFIFFIFIFLCFTYSYLMRHIKSIDKTKIKKIIFNTWYRYFEYNVVSPRLFWVCVHLIVNNVIEYRLEKNLQDETWHTTFTIFSLQNRMDILRVTYFYYPLYSKTQLSENADYLLRWWKIQDAYWNGFRQKTMKLGLVEWHYN